MAGRRRCSRRLARSVRKNARFLLSRERTGPFIARIVSQNVREAVKLRRRDRILVGGLGGAGLGDGADI